MHSNPIEWTLTPSVLTTVGSPHRRRCTGSLLGVVESLWTCYSPLVEKFRKLLVLSFVYFFISHFAHQQSEGKYLILLPVHLFTLHWKEPFVLHTARVDVVSWWVNQRVGKNVEEKRCHVVQGVIWKCSWKNWGKTHAFSFFYNLSTPINILVR